MSKRNNIDKGSATELLSNNTLYEKELLREAKAEHKRNLIKAGFDPKKRINVSKPTFVHWKALD